MTSSIADQFTYPRIRSCDLSHQMPRTNCRHRSCRGYRRGDERERQIERERRRPRFSSRDVNNDRNDRIRLPCQPPRVTSGPDWVASLSLLRTVAASRDLDREFGSLRCVDVTFSKLGNRRKRNRLARVALSLFFPSDLFPFPIPFPFLSLLWFVTYSRPSFPACRPFHACRSDTSISTRRVCVPCVFTRSGFTQTYDAQRAIEANPILPFRLCNFVTR